MTEEALDKIQKLIKHGKLKEALNELSHFIKISSKFRGNYLLIHQRLADLNTTYEAGLIKYEDYIIQRTSIAKSIISLSERTFEFNNNHLLSHIYSGLHSKLR